MRPWIRRLLIGLFVFVALLSAGGYYVYQATQYVPPFYEELLDRDETELQQAGAALEEQFKALHDEHEDSKTWTTILTDEQVNGWLAVNLREKFPRLLPWTVHNPRVVFAPGDAQIACQYISKNMRAVISLNVSANATDDANVVAIKLTNAKIGAVPGMIDMAIEEINQAARRAKVDLEWMTEDGAEVAYVTIPDDLFDEMHRFELHDVEIADGEVRIAGQLVSRESL